MEKILILGSFKSVRREALLVFSLFQSQPTKIIWSSRKEKGRETERERERERGIKAHIGFSVFQESGLHFSFRFMTVIDIT